MCLKALLGLKVNKCLFALCCQLKGDYTVTSVTWRRSYITLSTQKALQTFFYSTVTCLMEQRMEWGWWGYSVGRSPLDDTKSYTLDL